MDSTKKLYKCKGCSEWWEEGQECTECFPPSPPALTSAAVGTPPARAAEKPKEAKVEILGCSPTCKAKAKLDQLLKAQADRKARYRAKKRNIPPGGGNTEEEEPF